MDARLMFAEARGGVLQKLINGVWTNIRRNPDTEFRLRDQDADLQYGTISSIFRDKAINATGAVDHAYLRNVVLHCPAEFYLPETDTDHIRVYLLILSEALADEGL